MTEKIKLTPVEWEIMDCVWTLGDKVAVRDVVKHAFPNGEKAYTTVQTIMNKLHAKGVLKRQKIGNVNFFIPTKSQRNMMKQELTQFVSRVFDGSIQSLASFLLDSEELSLKEIQAIKDLLKQKEKDIRSQSS